MAITSFRATIGRVSSAAGGDGARGFAEGQASKDMRDIVGDFLDFCGHITNMSPEILVEALQPTFEKSLYYCPVDTGEMRDSGYLGITTRGKNAGAEIGYGKNGSPDYTPIVHESLEVAHASPTKAKWLQGAMEEDYFSLLQRVAAGSKRAAGMA
jgi:hypothetical protein